MKFQIRLIILLCSLLFISLSTSKKPSAKSAIKLLEGFCEYIPSSSTTILNKDVSIQSFYMSETEITNIQYLEFLMDLKRKGEFNKFKKANVDSAAWQLNMQGGKPYQDYYHIHPAYRDYPVVNVTKEGAELFCEWLSEKYDSISGGELSLKFRLPTRIEWIYAASGGETNWNYSWCGPYLKNKNGLVLANFCRLGAENISRDPETGEYIVLKDVGGVAVDNYADVTALAKSYWPNTFGLYNMNGNVSEMVSDGNFAVGGDWRSPGYDIRNESIKNFDRAHPTVGFRIVATYFEAVK